MGRKVAVDADFVIFVPWLRHTVVTQLGVAFAGDMEVYRMAVEIEVDGIDSTGRQIARQGCLILFLFRHS